MTLTPKTKLNDLLGKYPYLIDFLAEFHPKFSALKHPMLRNTLGRAATMGKVAAMGGISVDDLLEAIKGKVMAAGDGELEVVIGDQPRTREERREVLKSLITELHGGGDFDVIKQRFSELIEDVGPTEIAEMEQELIDAGMPETEIHRLCDVHAELFKDGLEQQDLPNLPPGHPVHTFIAENQALEAVAAKLEACVEQLGDPAEGSQAACLGEAESLLETFSRLNLHYLRKENQLFPMLEKHGASGPPQVMWAVHDDVRALLKQCRNALKAAQTTQFAEGLDSTLTKFRDMVFKEHHILLPMALSMLSEEEWLSVRHGEEAIGYALIEPGTEWPREDRRLKPRPGENDYVPPAPGVGRPQAHVTSSFATVLLNFTTGVLTPEQANLLFNHLPVEISFTDENHIVRFYSEGTERIFPRSPGVIGRHVSKCHPPKSVHMVEEILASFESGIRDVANFWINFNEKLIHIRYFAIRDEEGRFRGTLEVVQDVTEIQQLEGERRLLEWG